MLRKLVNVQGGPNIHFMETSRKWTRVQETSNRNIYGHSTKLNLTDVLVKTRYSLSNVKEVH